MKEQNYKNHLKFYVPHHFVFYPVVLALIIFSLYQYAKQDKPEFLLFACVFVLFGWLAFMLRQHYALGNQNRIVRLEMRLRYFQLANKKLEHLEQRLSFGQLAALRFASDEEFLPLIERTLAEDLSPDDIKKAIRHWEPDHMRV